MMLAVAAGQQAASSPSRAFEGRLPDPVVAGLYDYRDHVDAPQHRPSPIETIGADRSLRKHRRDGAMDYLYAA